MNNLLKTDLIRYLNSKGFKNVLLIIITIIAGITIIGKVAGPLNLYDKYEMNEESFRLMIVNSLKFLMVKAEIFPVIGAITALGTVLFVGVELDTGSVRNKLIVGKKRYQIYLSWVLTCAIVSSIIAIVGISLSWLSGILFFKAGSIFTLHDFLILLSECILAGWTYASFYMILATVPKMQPALIIFVMLILFASTLVTEMMYHRIYDNEKYFDSYDVDENGEYFEIQVENPNYHTIEQSKEESKKLSLWPTGELTLIVRNELNYDMIPYQIAVFIVYTSLGIVCFNKKELN